MNAIFELCPTLKNATFDAQMDAFVRMCIAHVLNDGEYVGLHETAQAYLESLNS
jgi:hypothetical protein